MLKTSYPLNFIRFGMQRKKELLRDVQETFDGIVLPANILLYQYKSTPTLIYMCNNKPFFVDPMSYLFGQPFDEFKAKVIESYEFKPSFEKLMTRHGLPVDHFVKYDYQKLLQYIDRDKKNLRGFIQNSLEFQLNTVRQNLKEFAGKLINEEDVDFDGAAYGPSFLIPPYFLYGSDITNKINLDILSVARDIGFDVPLYPMLFLRRVDLQGNSFSLILKKIQRLKFDGYCIWIDNFRESRVENELEVRSLINLIKELSENQQKDIIMMFGGYFSMLLYHFGLTGICHGTLFSESRGAMDSVKKTSGPAPVRYYIRGLHDFFTLDSALEILKKDNSLLCDCNVCKRIVRGKPENITNFQKEEALAEIHFFYNRFKEKKEIGERGPRELVDFLNFTRRSYDHIKDVVKLYQRPWGLEERPITDLNYITNWASGIGNSII